MINNSRRVYSNEEIRQMAIVGFDTNFVEYLRRAPERVKQIVENMLSTEQAKTELRASYVKDDMNLLIWEEKKEQLEMSVLKNNIETCDNIEGECQELEESNPYIDMDFTKRLELNELRIKIVSDTICHIHNNSFEKKQVVFIYGNGKRYGSYLQCCSRCKKLFATKEEFEELELSLKERDIQYSIEL